MKNNPNTTPNTIPPAALKLIEWFPIAEGPTVHIKGIRPQIKAKDVIKIGLNRNLAPAIADSYKLKPRFRSCTANSTIRIAFFANKPISIIIPTWRSEEHTSELQSRFDIVCRLLL